jgi:hypothetical protein
MVQGQNEVGFVVNSSGHLEISWEEKFEDCCSLKSNTFTLILEEEEVNFVGEYAPDCCGNYSRSEGKKRLERRTPYAQLGSIMKDESEICGCCVMQEACCKPVPIIAVQTDRMRMQPGAQGVCLNCSLVEGGAKYDPWVDAMVKELNARKVARGNIGQMKKAEDQEQRIEEVHSKLDAIMRHLQISYAGSPPSAQDMAR